jgi:hypothetical protein
MSANPKPRRLASLTRVLGPSLTPLFTPLSLCCRAVSKDTKEETMKVFKLFNGGADGGKITLANLKTVAKELGESMTDEELQEMIDHADKSNTNAVSFDDFYRLMAKRNAPQSAIDDLLGDDD